MKSNASRSSYFRPEFGLWDVLIQLAQCLWNHLSSNVIVWMSISSVVKEKIILWPIIQSHFKGVFYCCSKVALSVFINYQPNLRCFSDIFEDIKIGLLSYKMNVNSIAKIINYLQNLMRDVWVYTEIYCMMFVCTLWHLEIFRSLLLFW